MLDLSQHLLRQMAFSHATYGPGTRTQGVIQHIQKELIEVERSGGSALEWIDVVILALDGLTREIIFNGDTMGRGNPAMAADLACQLLLDKQARNEARTWPDWRTAPADKPIEHVRSVDVDACHE